MFCQYSGVKSVFDGTHLLQKARNEPAGQRIKVRGTKASDESSEPKTPALFSRNTCGSKRNNEAA